MRTSNKKNQRGTTIIETLFYLVILAMFSVAIINALISMTRAFKETRIAREIIESGQIMERITREIKQAYQINSIDTPEDLRLDKKINDTTTKVVEFSLENSNLKLLEDGTFIGNLNSPNIKIENLVFDQIITANGSAVKVFLTVSSLNDSQGRTYDFYDTAVIRGNY